MPVGRHSLALLLCGYVLTSPYYLVGSLQVGDVLALGLLGVVLMSPTATHALLQFLGGAYGWLAGASMIIALAVSIGHGTPLHDLTTAAQLTYVFWVVIPLVAVSVARTPRPLQFFERAGWVLMAVYAVGVVLLFAFQKTWILYITGPGRVFSPYNFVVFHHAAVCVAIVQLSRRARPTWRYVALLGLCTIPVLFATSRTGLLTLGLLVGVGVLWSARTLRGALTAAVAGALLVSLVTATGIQNSLGIRVLTAAAFFEDSLRVQAITRTLDRLREHPDALLWGLGWGNSGDGLVAHNLFIQLAAEGGVPLCIALSALLALPWIPALRGRSEDSGEARMATLLTLAVWVGLLLNAFPIERVQWLSFAVASGLAYRVRFGTIPRPAPAPLTSWGAADVGGSVRDFRLGR